MIFHWVRGNRVPGNALPSAAEIHGDRSIRDEPPFPRQPSTKVPGYFQGVPSSFVSPITTGCVPTLGVAPPFLTQPTIPNGVAGLPSSDKDDLVGRSLSVGSLLSILPAPQPSRPMPPTLWHTRRDE